LSEDVYLELKDPPLDLVANYRFPGQADFHPLAQNGISKKIPMPRGTNIVLVKLTWCGGSCVKRKDTDAPYTCPQQVSDTSSGQQPSSAPDQGGCSINVVFVRDSIATTGELLPAFIVSPSGLEISEALLEKAKSHSDATFTLNDTPISDYFSESQTTSPSSISPTGVSTLMHESIFGWSSVKRFRIQRYPGGKACSLYSTSDDVETLDVDSPQSRNTSWGKDNGINVAPSKVFDTYTLRQMLANTSSQLAAISGFNQASITGAYGTLQGITTDPSYLSAQVTTVATPTVSSVVSSGGTGSNTLANTLTLNNGQTGSSTTTMCPAGTLPSVGTSGVPACAPLSTWNGGSAGSGGASTGVGNPNGGTSTLGTSQSTNGSTLTSGYTGVQTANQANTVTTNSGGQVGTVAPVPVSTVPTAPTNISVSASDVLAEQVQLNSQITTLRLLLQGALSDQYLVKGSRAVGTRQQTTIGFGISLNPPQRFKHAVAEVRIWVDSAPEANAQVSVMNLLPADKTYNVAKITSSQKAFGAGVVLEPVSVGVAAGKSKSRLYLAKDTDTVALQFPTNKPDRVPRSAKEHVRDFLRPVGTWQLIEDACEDDPDPNQNSVVFGWQFRFVLGADYVAAGERWVYAQLALPTGLGEQFAPMVHIQTRWREYDLKRQVVGAVYKTSCSISEDPNPIVVISPLRVHKVYVDDMGSGVLKVSAEGDFLSSSFSVLSGPNIIAPTTFDGKRIQIFANASTLLTTDDLKLVAEDGRPTYLGMGFLPSPQLCNISSATMTAMPQPDGNSLVETKFFTGPRYSLDIDKAPHPLVLIGTQVYGLHETPFVGAQDGCSKVASSPTGTTTCVYHFIAATDALRAARTFTVRDIAWRDFKKGGTIEFEPSFTALAILGTKASSDDSECTKGSSAKAPCTPTPPPLYTLNGFQLEKLEQSPNHAQWNCTAEHCLELFRGLHQFKLTESNFKVMSQTTAVLELSEPTAAAAPNPYEYKSLKFIWHASEAEAVAWDLSIPQATKTAVTASAILNAGDSTQIVFNGLDPVLGPPLALTFDNVVIDPRTYKYEGSKKSLTVEITAAMTSKPGHKEMTLTGFVTGPDQKQTQKQIQLPFDVTRR
jgi:hypothetical protein